LSTHAEPEQSRAGYCWVVLAAALVITFMTLDMRSTLGVFFKAMIDDLGCEVCFQWRQSTFGWVAF